MATICRRLGCVLPLVSIITVIRGGEFYRCKNSRTWTVGLCICSSDKLIRKTYLSGFLKDSVEKGVSKSTEGPLTFPLHRRPLSYGVCVRQAARVGASPTPREARKAEIRMQSWGANLAATVPQCPDISSVQ